MEVKSYQAHRGKHWKAEVFKKLKFPKTKNNLPYVA
jgi:hypothetical protein